MGFLQYRRAACTWGSPPFLGCGDMGAYRFLEERIVHGWLCKCDRPDYGLTKFNGGSPSHCGGTCSSG